MRQSYSLPFNKFYTHLTERIAQVQTKEYTLVMFDGEIGLSLARDRIGRGQCVVPRVAVAHFRDSDMSLLLSIS